MNMNHYITDWSSSMGDTFAPLGGEDDDRLIELMWCNGHVVMQAQAPRKPPRPDKVAAHDDDEAAAQAWSQYPVEDPLERADLFAELFGEAQAAVGGGSAERGGEAARQSSRMMPPPPRPAHATREDKACPGDGVAATATAADGAGSSVLTIGSSFRGRNHAQPPPPPPPGDVAKARDAATTRARSCTTKSEQPGPGAARRSGKRKQSDATDAEDAGLESADATCEPTQSQRMTTAKRRRAAQVHNLSERRRRDRINEKMKALQELIPHCNKADKASMLDEAIEYLKSLQLQLQMMWMGGGIVAPPPPPVVHQYMQRTMAAAARAPPHVASLPAGMPAFAAPPAVHAPPAPAPDLYARYVAVDHLPPSPPSVPPPPPYTAAGDGGRLLPAPEPRAARDVAFRPKIRGMRQNVNVW